MNDEQPTTWRPEDQRRVDEFVNGALRPIIAAGDPHLVFVAVHGFLLAAGLAIEHDVTQRPASAWHYLNLIDTIRAHVERAAAAATAAQPTTGPTH